MPAVLAEGSVAEFSDSIASRPVHAESEEGGQHAFWAQRINAYGIAREDERHNRSRGHLQTSPTYRA